MTKKHLKWYDRLWQSQPPTEAVRKKAITSLIDTFSNKASILNLTGKINEALAILNQAESLQTRIDDLLCICRLKNQKTWILINKGKYITALDISTEVIEHLKNCHDKAARKIYCSALANMATVYWNQGDYQSALHTFEKVKQIYEAGSDLQGSARIIDNMGLIYFNLGNYSQAMRCFKKRKQLAIKMGDRRGYGMAVNHIGLLHQNQDDYLRALRCFEDVKQIYIAIGDRQGYGNVMGNMGNLYQDLGDYPQSLRCYEEVKQIFKAIDNRRGYSLVLGNMGLVYQYQGDYQGALRCYEKQKQIAKTLGDRRGFGIAIGNMGNLYYDQGRTDEALDCFESAIATHQEIGFKYGLTYWLVGKTRILLDRQDFVPARAYADEAVVIASEIPKPDMLFIGRVLQAMIDFIGFGNLKSLATLEKMLTEADPSTFQGQEQIATLHYELWRMLNQMSSTSEAGGIFTLENHRQAALELYQQLYEKTPKYEYKKRIEELLSLEKR